MRRDVHDNLGETRPSHDDSNQQGECDSRPVERQQGQHRPPPVQLGGRGEPYVSLHLLGASHYATAGAIMRPAVAMLAILTSGALSLAFADPPATPVASESRSTTTPNSTAEDSTGQNSAAHSVPATAATAAKAPAVAPAKPTPSASGERMAEHLLRSQGYKLSMVNGQEKYCRREIALGSHLATVMRCVTVAEAEAMAREGREVTEQLQRSMSSCQYGTHGANCGN